jgi:hypothetical protein
MIAEVPAIPAPLLPTAVLETAVVQPAIVQTAVPPLDFATQESIDKDSLIEAGRLEVFGARAKAVVKPLQAPLAHLNMEVNPLRVAYSKLPMALKQKKYNLEIQKMTAQMAESALPNGTQIAGA